MDGPSFTVEVSRSLHDPRWDDFLDRCPSGHHEQTSLWAQVKANYGWSPIRHVIFENGGICGGFQILCKSLHHFGRIGYISHGPAIGREDEALKRYVALQIDRAARKERLAYLVVVPGYPDQNVAAQLKKVGFKEKPNWLPPTGLMQATFLVDLRDDFHVIRGRMHRKARKNIRYGLKTGLIVREGRDEKDVDTFRSLLEALCRRKGILPTPPQPDFFQHLWRVFSRHGILNIFLAEFGQRAIAGLLAFSFGDTVRLWKAGWDGSMPKHYPNELLYWRTIEWAKENGFHNLDLVGANRRWAEPSFETIRPRKGPNSAKRDSRRSLAGAHFSFQKLAASSATRLCRS